jgi:elongation factor P
MNSSNFEQEFVGEDQIDEARNFLKENTVCTVLFYKDRPISITIPIFMNLRIVKADPWVKGDTASGDSKPATLETGYVLQVPTYLEEGQLIKIDTRTGAYVERMKG